MKRRETWVHNDEVAGCYICKGGVRAMWRGKGAKGHAALHHDKTGHTTWVKQNLEITYGSLTQKSDVLAHEAEAAG